MRDNLRATVWRLAVFLTICGLGAFALLAVFANLRRMEEDLHEIAHRLEELTGKEARTVVLGHLLRGGSPTSFDRLVALRFGAAAVRALDEGQSAVMVSLNPPTVRYEPLKEAVRRMKTVTLDSDTVETARDLGICFGD